jgi:hypothetical protein
MIRAVIYRVKANHKKKSVVVCYRRGYTDGNGGLDDGEDHSKRLAL